MNKKVGIWVVLILTSLALIIPSVAIVYNLLTQSRSQVVSTPGTINSDDIKVSIETAAPEVTSVSTPAVTPAQ